jgi:hypothetical protein
MRGRPSLLARQRNSAACSSEISAYPADRADLAIMQAKAALATSDSMMRSACFQR